MHRNAIEIFWLPHPILFKYCPLATAVRAINPSAVRLLLKAKADITEQPISEKMDITGVAALACNEETLLALDKHARKFGIPLKIAFSRDPESIAAAIRGSNTPYFKRLVSHCQQSGFDINSITLKKSGREFPLLYAMIASFAKEEAPCQAGLGIVATLLAAKAHPNPAEPNKTTPIRATDLLLGSGHDIGSPIMKLLIEAKAVPGMTEMQVRRL